MYIFNSSYTKLFLKTVALVGGVGRGKFKGEQWGGEWMMNACMRSAESLSKRIIIKAISVPC